MKFLPLPPTHNMRGVTPISSPFFGSTDEDISGWKSKALDLFNRNGPLNGDLRDLVVVTSCFWLCQNTLQLMAGALKVHSGRSGGIVSLFGFTSFVVSFSASMIAKNKINEALGQPGSMTTPDPNWSPYSIFGSSGSSLTKYREVVRCFYVSSLAYILLEGKFFGTAVPSSLISLGVFSKGLRGSVAATGDVATEGQRRAIQRLGRVFGCHHCSSRQVLTGSNFIADHMPPTKTANEMNRVWWRRLLKIEVKQRLWPQCQSCFQQQGQAVRMGVHVPIYHWGPKLCQLAPAAGMLLCMHQPLRDHTDWLVDETMDIAEDIMKVFKDIKSRLNK